MNIDINRILFLDQSEFENGNDYNLSGRIKIEDLKNQPLMVDLLGEGVSYIPDLADENNIPYINIYHDKNGYLITLDDEGDIFFSKYINEKEYPEIIRKIAIITELYDNLGNNF